MRILVACESSGVVRRAFRLRGHDAWSCDILPAEDDSPFHFQADAESILNLGWDLLIAHPPCTYLCNSGVRWLTTIPKTPKKGVVYGPARRVEMEKAADLFRAFWQAPIEKVCIENPVMHCYGRELVGATYAQTIQPWQFGHGEVKRTCLWLRGLSKLQPTDIVEGRAPKVHYASPGPDRWRVRSRTYEGIAAAMAEQWGG